MERGAVTYVIPIPVWYTKVHILLWPPDLRAQLAALGITGKDADEMIIDDNDAITWTTPRSEGVIVVKREQSGAALIGTLAHEVFHVVHSMLQERAVKLRDNDSNEAHAYLIGYLMEEIVKVIPLDKPAQAA